MQYARKIFKTKEEDVYKRQAGKLQAGMMTSLEYKEQEYKMESSRLNAEMAAVSLFQAMETYDWSVKGLASAE